MINGLLLASNATATGTVSAPYSSVSILYSGMESFLFPFLLVFAIVYGVLEKSEIFKDKHDINSIIALVLAIIFATTNYTLKLTYILLPVAAVIVVVLFLIIVVFSMVQTGFGTGQPKLSKVAKFILGVIISIILIALLAYIFVPSSNIVSSATNYLPYVVIAVIFIGAIYALSR
ncbi:MAG: hypothetical protein RAK22_02340 [Nanoarchaeota archaeon]|nr:hypothetical protein [Nanoarchaeota archaeon]